MLLSKLMQRVGTLFVILGLLGGQLTPAYASMVGTSAALQQAQRNLEREELREMLDRDAVRSQLHAMGVDADAAKERVAAMTDDEVRRVNMHLSQMPAGGDILGVVLVVFIVFVVTDVLGATDIFPFIHPIR